MEDSLNELYDAWENPGNNPDYHFQKMAKLMDEWKPLYRAMTKFCIEYEKLNGVSQQIPVDGKVYKAVIK